MNSFQILSTKVLRSQSVGDFISAATSEDAAISGNKALMKRFGISLCAVRELKAKIRRGDKDIKFPYVRF